MTLDAGSSHGPAETGVNGSEARPLSSGSSREGVLSLRGRTPSATIGSRMSLSRDEANAGGSGRDSLEDTRAFYGLRPMSPQSTNSRHTAPRSGVASTRNQDRSSSGQFSSHNRPTSPGAGSSTAASPIRNSIPLPLSRSFLSPKKPKAAIRAEAAEAQLREAESRRNLSTIDQADSRDALSPSSTASALPRDIDEEGPSLSAEAAPNPTLPSSHPDPHASILSDAPAPARVPAQPDLVDSLNLGPPDDPAHRRHSVTTATSSHLRQMPTHDSAEGLVRPSTSAEKPPHSEISAASRVTGANPTRRRFESFENPLTTWFCGGHLMTGGDHYWSLLAAVVVLLGLTGVWLGTTGVWLWLNGTEYGLAPGGGIAIVIILVYLFGVVFSSLLVASFRDPGIIPRGLDPDPPTTQEGSWDEPLDRTFVVKKGKVSVRYCETCGIYRPPRSSHCRLCGNCVDGIDHHCSYLHNCVGKRNYFMFLTLMVSSAFSSIYIVVFSALHFSLLCHHDGITFGRALQESPGAAVSFLLGIAVLPGILFLLGYHCRLLLHNLTTIEQIRASASKNLWKARTRPDNPFASDSILSNIFIASLGRPQFPSWVQAHKLDPPDRRLPNPALTDQQWWAWEKPI